MQYSPRHNGRKYIKQTLLKVEFLRVQYPQEVQILKINIMDTNNPILEKMCAEKISYCHVIEVESVYELELIIESLYTEFSCEFKDDDIIDFISSLSVYSLNEDNEDEIYIFNITEFLTNLI